MRCVALSTLWLLALGACAPAQAIDAAGADGLSADLRRYIGGTAFARGTVRNADKAFTFLGEVTGFTAARPPST